MRTLLAVLSISCALASVGEADSLEIATSSAYIHGDGSLLSQLDTSATSYFSTLDGSNIGTFGWSYTNTTGSAIANFTMFAFLDADIDRDLNTFFNEYGELAGLSLPPAAPGGSIAPSSWQIDEPGFVFGTILSDLAAGSLRNDNFVPSSAPDDVSLALGFDIGTLSPGQTATLTMQISRSNIAGLHQLDPDSNLDFYLNGSATAGQAPVNSVPEPGAWLLLSTVAVLTFRLHQRRHSS